MEVRLLNEQTKYIVYKKPNSIKRTLETTLFDETHEDEDHSSDSQDDDISSTGSIRDNVQYLGQLGDDLSVNTNNDKQKKETDVHQKSRKNGKKPRVDTNKQNNNNKFKELETGKK